MSLSLKLIVRSESSPASKMCVRTAKALASLCVSGRCVLNHVRKMMEFRVYERRYLLNTDSSV